MEWFFQYHYLYYYCCLCRRSNTTSSLSMMKLWASITTLPIVSCSIKLTIFWIIKRLFGSMSLGLATTAVYGNSPVDISWRCTKCKYNFMWNIWGENSRCTEKRNRSLTLWSWGDHATHVAHYACFPMFGVLWKSKTY